MAFGTPTSYPEEKPSVLIGKDGERGRHELAATAELQLQSVMIPTFVQPDRGCHLGKKFLSRLGGQLVQYNGKPIFLLQPAIQTLTLWN